jgi:phosphate transport system permease protein
MIEALRLPLRVRRGPDRFEVITTIAALAAPMLVLGIVIVLARQAGPAIERFGPQFLVTRNWNPVSLDFGALPFIAGTAATSAIALALALPVGVAVALVLAEPGAKGLRAAIGTGVELLAAIPSVVYGIWALYVMGPYVYAHVEVPLNERFGFLGIFSGQARQTSLLTASLVLAIMVLPTLSAISRDVLRAVPTGLRESAVALGATWWETNWKVTLPAAKAGIFGATILALGRALGETIAVTMVIGNRPDVPQSLFAPAYTLASVIANEFTEATGPVYPAALVELGLVLIFLTFGVNIVALLLVRRTVEPAR